MKKQNLGSKTKELWKNPKYRKRMSDAHKGNKKAKGAYSFGKGEKNVAKKISIRKKISMAKTGKKNNNYGKRPWNYKGGSVINTRVRHLFEYRQWRSDVFTRDDWTCQACCKRGGWLEAHHCKKEFAKIIDENNIKTIKDARKCVELWDINNGETLCGDCHNLTKRSKRSKKYA